MNDSAFRNPKLVMIVDDDPDDIEITRRVLSRCGRGIDIRSAASGEEALRLLLRAEELPSLVFIDLKMRGMSGIDTVLKIRADERLKHIPMVIMTNSTLESDMRKAYEAGVSSFIHKAFDIDQFSRDIKAHLDCWLK
jgi:CheY-like chemotaxis protein